MKCSVVLLEHPRPISATHFNDVAHTPLSSCLMNGYICSMLRDRGYNAEIYDSCIKQGSFSECFKKLFETDCDILGINAVYLWERTAELFSCLRKIKAVNSRVPIILFGFFPTFSYREIFNLYPFIDCVIIGEPEETFLEIVSSFVRCGHIEYEKVPGIAFKQDGAIRTTGSRPLIHNLDGLPFPEQSDAMVKTVGANILGSRGCYAQCMFCYINNFYGNGCYWRGRSPGNIAHEIESILPRLTEPYIYFVDANFFGSGTDGRKRSVSIIERIKDWPDLQFGIECRSNDLDEKIISLMAEAGLKDVFLGIESASPNSLKRMRKGIRPERNAEAVAVLRSYGIEPNLGFIMFEPDATLADVRDNFEFLKSNCLLESLACTANVLYHREIILKGTPHYSLLHKKNRLIYSDPIAYEGCYAFSHETVGFLADCMENVCREIFMTMQNKLSPLYWEKVQTHAARRINDFLVYMFGELLRRLELGDISPDAEEQLKWEKRASDVIQGIIVSERVCQV